MDTITRIVVHVSINYKKCNPTLGLVGHCSWCRSHLETLCASLGWCCWSSPLGSSWIWEDATPESLWKAYHSCQMLPTDTPTRKSFVRECTSLQTMDMSGVSQLRSPLLRSCPQSRETWLSHSQAFCRSLTEGRTRRRHGSGSSCRLWQAGCSRTCSGSGPY